MQEVRLRFVIKGHLPGAEIVRFLRSLEHEIRGYLAELESFEKDHGEGPVLGRFAFENGLATDRAHTAWAARILKRGQP